MTVTLNGHFASPFWLSAGKTVIGTAETLVSGDIMFYGIIVHLFNHFRLSKPSTANCGIQITDCGICGLIGSMRKFHFLNVGLLDDCRYQCYYYINSFNFILARLRRILPWLLILIS